MSGNAAEVIVDAKEQFPGDQHETGGKHLYAESGRLRIDASNALVRFYPRYAASKLGTRAKTRAEESDTLVLVVVVGENGFEKRVMRPLMDAVLPMAIEEPGKYEAFALSITGSSVQFADEHLDKPDPETGKYRVQIVERDKKGKAQLMKLPELTHCIPFKAQEFEVEEAAFVVHNDNRFHRWADLWFQGPPRTRFSRWLRYLNAVTFQIAVMIPYMIGKGAWVGSGWLHHAFLFASRDYDWRSAFDPSYTRSKNAADNCRPFTMTRFNKYGTERVQADSATILGAPIFWWPMLLASWFLNGGLVNFLTTGSIWPTSVFWFIFTSFILIGAVSLLFRKGPNDDGDMVHAWRSMLDGLHRSIRNLKLSNIPGMRELNLDGGEASVIDAISKRTEAEVQKSLSYGIKFAHWVNNISAKLFRPVLAGEANENLPPIHWRAKISAGIEAVKAKRKGKVDVDTES